MKAIIPLSQFVKFIQSQPDERKINMTTASTHDKGCGCILVHFGRESVGLVHHFHSGFMSAYCESGGGFRVEGLPIDFISDAIDKKVKNYKQAKELLAELKLDKPLDIGA